MTSSNSTSTVNGPVFGYVPTEWLCIVFILLFGASTFYHIVQARRFQLWWLLPSAAFCGFLELVGWLGRLWASQKPTLLTPYIIAVTTLIIAPTPLVAANFIILGRIIRRLGPQYSRLTPRRYTKIFVTCDIISLVVQAMGGGMAAGSKSSQSQVNLGSHIALVGIIFQLMAIFVYCALAAEFISRYAQDRPKRVTAPGEATRGVIDQSLKRMLYAMSVMTTFIVIRTLYRVVEFVDGWNGKVNTTQWYFIVFDGLMIILAMLTLNVFHPGIYLGGSDHPLSTTSEGLSLVGYPKTGVQVGETQAV